MLLPLTLWAQGTPGSDGVEKPSAPEFAFDGDNLVMTTQTEGASIFYAMADLPSTDDEAIVDSVTNRFSVKVGVDDNNFYYEQPFELMKSVVLKAIAVGTGTNGQDAVSDTTVLVYDYEAWLNLLQAAERGKQLMMVAEGNSKVDQTLVDELKWALEESTMIYNYRANMPYFEAKHFAMRINEICDQIEALLGEGGIPEPYAVLSYSESRFAQEWGIDYTKTLTFYYDDQRESRGGMIITPFESAESVPWKENQDSITSVVFDSSFAEYKNVTSTAYWFAGCQFLLEVKGIHNLITDNVSSMSNMFNYCYSLKTLDVSGFNTINVTDMSGVFSSCSSLTNLDVSGFNTDNVMDMSYMFSGCSGLTSLDVSGFNTSNVMNMDYMFSGCTNLTNLDVSGFNTDNVREMASMFSHCLGLTTLDLSSFNTSNVTNMGNLFYGCQNLNNLNVSGFNTENVTNMERMFWDCPSVKVLDLSSFNTAKVLSFSLMFSECPNLTTVYVGDAWSTESVKTSTNMFTGSTSLVGGAGTIYDANHTNYTYAHIDGGESNPGYFTDKNATAPVEKPAAPEFAFEGDNLTMTTQTEGTSIFYAMADLPSTDDEAVVDSVTNSFMVKVGVDDGNFYYEQPFELKKSVVVKAIAVGNGTNGQEAVSDTTVLVYDYEAWVNLLKAADRGNQLMIVAEGNSKVDQSLVEELKWALEESTMIYNYRANMPYFEAKHFTQRINELCDQIEALLGSQDEIIQFADANVKAICVQNWDTNADGELSTGEASAVTDLGGVFKNQTSCTSFDELRFFTSLTALGADEFRSCPFTSVILPPSLQSIGRYAFDGTKLTEITIPASVTYIDGTGLNDRSFLNFYVDEASNSFCAVDGVLFSKDTTLLQNYPIGRNDASYVIPNTVTTIGSCSFYGSKLASVVIPNGVKRIDHGAFRYCSLENVDIPNTVEIIEGENFQYCDRLTFVFVPNSVSFLGEDVFSACASLATIDVDSNNPNYASVDGILYSKDMTTLQIYPAGRPETSYTIADHVKVIGSHAFDFAVNLVSVVIPNSVESIGYLNFVNISGLMSVTVQRAEPIQIGTGYFNSNTLQNGTLYVPKGAKSLYEAAEGWNKFNNIVEIESEPTFSFDGFGVLTVWGGMSLADALEAAGGHAEVAKKITAIIWNNDVALSSSDLEGLDNPNMLVYVLNESLAPQNRDNVIVGDMAKNIVLTDVAEGNGSYYCPRDFKAEIISYTRNFSQQTEVGVARGWETIALPFTVQTITHEKQGVIAPFNNTASNKHFWLRQVAESENGGRLTGATTIEAYTPYLISMPNSEAYPAEYCLNGQVTFSAQDALVGRTELYPKEIRTADGGMIMMVPCFGGQTATQDVYALNVGVQLQEYPEGSVFVRASRDVRPFEVFTVHHGGNAPQLISIQDLNGGSMTGIEDVRSMMSDGRGNEWFDLSGRKLQGKPSRTGVYIVNGKKKVVK